MWSHVSSDLMDLNPVFTLYLICFWCIIPTSWNPFTATLFLPTKCPLTFPPALVTWPSPPISSFPLTPFQFVKVAMLLSCSAFSAFEFFWTWTWTCLSAYIYLHICIISLDSSCVTVSSGFGSIPTLPVWSLSTLAKYIRLFSCYMLHYVHQLFLTVSVCCMGENRILYYNCSFKVINKTHRNDVFRFGVSFWGYHHLHHWCPLTINVHKKMLFLTANPGWETSCF